MKLDKNLGFVFIEEQTSPEVNIVKNLDVIDKNGIFYVKFLSCLHSFDVMNRNSRLYQAHNIAECLKTEKILHFLSHGGWYGEMNHPTSKYKNQPLSSERILDIDMDNTSHRMLNPHIEGNLLISNIESDAGTNAGMNLARKMVQGFIPCFSCRAIASLFLNNGKPTVNVRQIITYDWVLYPSHREAEQTNINNTEFINKSPKYVSFMNEYTSQDILIPIKDLVKNDSNVQVLMESFDLNENDILGIAKNKKHLIMRDNNNTIYCNIDQNSKRKVDDFFRSFK